MPYSVPVFWAALPDETMAGETSAGETQAGETSAGETSADETSADETSADETQADETQADEMQADVGRSGDVLGFAMYRPCSWRRAHHRLDQCKSIDLADFRNRLAGRRNADALLNRCHDIWRQRNEFALQSSSHAQRRSLDDQPTRRPEFGSLAAKKVILIGRRCHRAIQPVELQLAPGDLRLKCSCSGHHDENACCHYRHKSRCSAATGHNSKRAARLCGRDSSGGAHHWSWCHDPMFPRWLGAQWRSHQRVRLGTAPNERPRVGSGAIRSTTRKRALLARGLARVSTAVGFLATLRTTRTV